MMMLVGSRMDRKKKYRLNNTEEHQDYAIAPTMAEISLPPAAADRQACVSLDEGSESRLKRSTPRYNASSPADANRSAEVWSQQP
jgi:hypothetical protein